MRTVRRLLLVALILMGLLIAGSAFAQANKPVTFTQLGWRNQGQGLVYNSWKYAFYRFSFYGFTRQNWLYAGGRRTMSIEGSRSTLSNLIRWLPQTSAPRSLTSTQDFVIPVPLPYNAGSLAGEVVALTMNVAYNDMRLMPRHPGYDLELFTVRTGPMRGRTVGQVLDIANRILGGDPPLRYSLPSYQAITDVVRAINANYEFINYATYIDRGYLTPNRSLGPAAPSHYPHVP